MDLFIHDSDHSYAAMRWELERAWACLARGGWIVADDAHMHSALEDVARSVDATPLYVRQGNKQDWTGWTGLLRNAESRA